MISIARIFGAPVTEPQGKSAASSRASDVPPRNLPVTRDTIWCTVA